MGLACLHGRLRPFSSAEDNRPTNNKNNKKRHFFLVESVFRYASLNSFKHRSKCFTGQAVGGGRERERQRRCECAPFANSFAGETTTMEGGGKRHIMAEHGEWWWEANFRSAFGFFCYFFLLFWWRYGLTIHGRHDIHPRREREREKDAKAQILFSKVQCQHSNVRLKRLHGCRFWFIFWRKKKYIFINKRVQERDKKRIRVTNWCRRVSWIQITTQVRFRNVLLDCQNATCRPPSHPPSLTLLPCVFIFLYSWFSILNGILLRVLQILSLVKKSNTLLLVLSRKRIVLVDERIASDLKTGQKKVFSIKKTSERESRQ